MAQLRQDYDEFVKRDAEVIVVGPEDETAFARYWEKEDLRFVGLPDPEHTFKCGDNKDLAEMRGREPQIHR